MEFVTALLLKSVLQTWTTLLHNWPFLVVSVVIAACLKLFTDPNKISAFLMRYRKAGVVGATAVAVVTPLCSCGTTAIILGMMASTMPWAPIIAFMVASPLTSPQELIYSAGIFGWPFALAFFVSSIVLGLLGGLIGEILDRRGWLKNQSRFSASTVARSEPVPQTTSAPQTACACDSASFTRQDARPSIIRRPLPNRSVSASAPLASTRLAGEAAMTLTAGFPAPAQPALAGCGCGSDPVQPAADSCACSSQPATPTDHPAVTWRVFLSEVLSNGKRLLVMFVGFAFIGYFLNGLIPSAWVGAVFGQGNIYSVPLAATLGLPLYINTEASLPLVSALIASGMSQGAALALLITGAGTSIGAFAGALTIARWRVIAVVIATLWLGAIGMGYLYDFLHAAALL